VRFEALIAIDVYLFGDRIHIMDVIDVILEIFTVLGLLVTLILKLLDLCDPRVVQSIVRLLLLETELHGVLLPFMLGSGRIRPVFSSTRISLSPCEK